MKMPRLSEVLVRLQAEPLFEAEFMGGPGMDDRPEAAGDRNYNTLRGAQKNFQSFDDNGSAWPYEDDGEMSYGVPSWEGGKGVWGRGDRPGSDVSGQPPTPRDQGTWSSGPDDVEEGADWDELQRHGDDKARNLWRDTPDGKQWTEMNNEAMGMPMQTGPVAPMDGLSHNTGKDADPVEDEDGNPIVPKNAFQQTYFKDKSGPAGQWGAAETIPGQSRGWASSPVMGDEPQDVWKVPEEKDAMKLREFFDPRPVPVEEVGNPDPEHLEDQSDEELEDKMGADEPHDDGFGDPPDDNDGFDGRLGGTSLFVLPKPGQDSEFVSTPDKMGAARGTYGMHSDGQNAPDDLVDKSSAWDVLQSVICAMAHEEEEEEPQMNSGIPGEVP